jgi:hypothetical protein
MIDITCNYDPAAPIVPLIDEQIAIAMPFIGHEPKFLDWPKRLWRVPEHNVPCEDPAMNAYHVRYLSEIMRDRGWIGGPFKVNVHRHCWDANHRIRAAKYLLAMGVIIDIPEPSVSVKNPHVG